MLKIAILGGKLIVRFMVASSVLRLRLCVGVKQNMPTDDFPPQMTISREQLFKASLVVSGGTLQ